MLREGGYRESPGRSCAFLDRLNDALSFFCVRAISQFTWVLGTVCASPAVTCWWTAADLALDFIHPSAWPPRGAPTQDVAAKRVA